jgi:hypothetical protein
MWRTSLRSRHEIRVIDVLDLFAAGLSLEQILANCLTWNLRIWLPALSLPASGWIIRSWPHDLVEIADIF